MENWLTKTLAVAVRQRRPIALIAETLTVSAKIRVYKHDGETEFTFMLDEFTAAIQAEAIDIIYPAL